MANRKFLAVGFSCPGNEMDYVPLDSDQSLLDADVILFKPGIPYGHYKHEDYNGKPLLHERGSFAAVEEARHWKSELAAAVNGGKTVIVLLSKPQEVFVYTGNRTFSGTGKNRATTLIVKPFSSYDALPVTFSRVVPKSGEIIVPATDLKYLSGYWKDFSASSRYEVYLEGSFTHTFLTTKTGSMAVGAAVHSKGLLLLLPPLTYDEDEFIDEDPESGKQIWSEPAKAFGKRLVKSIVELEKAARSDREATPAPEWASDTRYRLLTETTIERQIAEVGKKLQELQAERKNLRDRLDVEGSLRRLLFERGHELENAVIDSLRLMGFSAENFADNESEFDAVFTSPEGRFLGEAEGKDNRAVNIDKLSQLERNLQEDFNREEVSSFAKGVLFGNAHRLVAPLDRAEFFTEKCISGAQRSKIALVRTPDMFPVAKYLKENNDSKYAQRCREAIASAEGCIVVFPDVPVSLKETTVQVEGEEGTSSAI